jgi:ornithine carbamoyltransferase
MNRRRHWLTIRDWDALSLEKLLGLAIRLKQNPLEYTPLAGKTLAMIFHKASTRTRVSFEVGMVHLGGYPLMISASTSQLSRGEPIEDSARVMSRYVDGVMIRTFDHDELERWAEFSEVPIINGLTDLYHPCQVLTDLLTIKENFGDKYDWSELEVAWVGDGNNMTHSWIEAACTLGFKLNIACPKGFDPNSDILNRAQTEGANIIIFRDPKEAVAGVHIVNTDVWVSMGQEEESSLKRSAFDGFQVDENLMNLAHTEAIFLHCLPAHRGEEVSETVLESERSKVWDQAENRLHAQKALLAYLMGEMD